MAHKKAGGSTRLGRDSQSKRLGVKIYGGASATAGAVIIRQRGNKFRPGVNVGQGNDDTLFALKPGIVSFTEKRVVKFTGSKARVKLVHVAEKST